MDALAYPGLKRPTLSHRFSMNQLADLLPRTAEAIAADFAAGQHKGFQIYVSRRGETIAHIATGEASPGVPMTSETLVCWLSSGKPITAMAIALLWQRGLLSLDDRVMQHVPGVRRERERRRHDSPSVHAHGRLSERRDGLSAEELGGNARHDFRGTARRRLDDRPHGRLPRLSELVRAGRDHSTRLGTIL